MVARVIEIVDVQDLDGQTALNVYHFVDPDGVGDEDTLVSDYVSDVLPLMKVIQGTQLHHVAIRHRQIFPTAELIHETPISPTIAGTVSTGDALQSAYALSYKWNLGATVNLAGAPPHIKRGGTRVAGIRTTQVNENVVGGDVATAAAAWIAELRNPGTDAFLLCVVSFLAAGSPRVRVSTATQYALVTGATGLAPSTQNTRKVLRGRTF